MATTNERLNIILGRLGERFMGLTDQEKSLFIGEIHRQLRNGWTDDDIVKYQLCSEEMNPELDEEVALARMDRISAKYGESVKPR